jgi:ABC-type transport system involved in multi-copper enzyme maturation permease subunit|tara:strand:- start:9672 stop:11078 length:1407 start_codon:yes stop_codon:yes gene_type:complete
MFRIILDKELREIIGTTKFAVTFGVCAVLILLAFYVGARNYEVSRQEYEAAVAENIQQMQGLTDWGDIDHRIFLPPQPLATLVSGVSNDIGRTVNMQARGELRSEGSRFNEDPLFAVFRYLDLEFIFAIILSLFAILFGYDAVNGEKERGTLRLAFANPVPRDQYILGKIVGSFLALIVPLMIPILIGCLMLPVLGVPMDTDSWLRLGMVILAGVLYFGVFLTLSVFMSTLMQNSSASLMSLLVVWIFAVLIIPRTSVLVAGRSVEVPSVDEIDYEKSKYAAQLWNERMDAMQRWMKVNYNDDHRQMRDGMRAFSTEQQALQDEKMNTFVEQLNEQRAAKSDLRTGVALSLARISPTASFSLAASDLAYTSMELRSSYLATANAYQEEYATFMRSKNVDYWGRHRRHGGGDDEEPEAIDTRELPVFAYAQPPVSEAIKASLPDLGLLFMFNAIFFSGAFVRFLRFDLR